MNYTFLFLSALSAILVGVPAALWLCVQLIAVKIRQYPEAFFAGFNAMSGAQRRDPPSVPGPAQGLFPATEEEWEQRLLETERYAVEQERSEALRQRVFERLLRDGKLPSFSRSGMAYPRVPYVPPSRPF